MKGNIKLKSLLLILLVFVLISNMGHLALAQIFLLNNSPITEGPPVPDDYEFNVLNEDHAVIGVRSLDSDNFDLEIYEDTTYLSLIDTSSSVGNVVDFVVLDKNDWEVPPTRGARVSSSTTGYVIEMENNVEDHSIMDTWTRSMDEISGNPVFNLGPPGSWDDTYVGHPSVYYDGAIFHMWYGGLNSNVKIGYATSSDRVTWTRNPSNPVLDLGSPGSWEDNNVHYPNVIYNGSGYQMWYSGHDDTNYRIGYATSPDGITWTKDPSNPVLNLGPGGSFDELYAGQPSVMYDGMTYHMWYSGVTSGGIGRTGYATSSDGISWSKYGGNPILNIGPSGSWDDVRANAPEVIYQEGIYHMWYSGSDGSHYRIGYAYSMDGVNWTKYPGNPVLDLGPSGSWDDYNVAWPSIVYDGTMYHMWYSGSDGVITRLGYATSPDGITWTKFYYAEVLDSYEITDMNSGSKYSIILDVPPSLDLDMFIFNTTGGRDDAIAYSSMVGLGFDESITFTAPSTGDYLLVITNENGGTGSYTISFDNTPPMVINLSVQPDPQEVYGNVNITATVVDNLHVSSVWVEIKNPTGGMIGNFSMEDISGKDTFYFEQTYNILGQYSFTIWANDTTDNWATASDTFVIHDTISPIISDIVSIPNPQEIYSFVRTSAKISDNYILDGSWIEIYDSTSTLIGNFTLLYDSIFDRYYYEQEYDILGDYSFTIWAKDSVDNWNSDSGTFNIEDTTPPAISDVTTTPAPQDVFKDSNVSAIISDNYLFDGAWIDIRDPDGNLVGNYSMAYDSIADRYFVVETYNIIGDYLFTIWVNDTSDNWVSYSGTFLIEDNQAPVILNAMAIPDPQEVFGTVEISANVTDNYELSTVQVEVRNPQGNLIANVQMEHSVLDDRYYWNQSYDIIGIHTYIVRANDTSDNLASVSGTFLIQDSTPPVISNLDVNPGLQKLKEPLNISCSISDNYELDVMIIEIKDPDGIVINNFSKRYDSTFEEFYLNQSYDNPGVYTFTIWANDSSDNRASTTGSFEIEEEEEPDEYNWKPIVAFIFTLILLIVGILIVLSHPIKLTDDLGRDRIYSFFAGVLPFVVAEALTGIVSFFTGLLAVPPLFGVGMIVDLGILIVGIVCGLMIYVKGVPSDYYMEEPLQDPQTDSQTPLKTFHLDGSPKQPDSPESPSPESPPEEIPKEPEEEPQTEPEEEPPTIPPEPDEEPPATPPKPPFESIPPPIIPPLCADNH